MIVHWIIYFRHTVFKSRIFCNWYTFLKNKQSMTKITRVSKMTAFPQQKNCKLTKLNILSLSWNLTCDFVYVAKFWSYLIPIREKLHLYVKGAAFLPVNFKLVACRTNASKVVLASEKKFYYWFTCNPTNKSVS